MSDEPSRAQLEWRIEELEAELHGTVTTKYHDDLMHQWQVKVVELEAENERLTTLRARDREQLENDGRALLERDERIEALTTENTRLSVSLATAKGLIAQLSEDLQALRGERDQLTAEVSRLKELAAPWIDAWSADTDYEKACAELRAAVWGDEWDTNSGRQPCGVCGSTEYPHICEGAIDVLRDAADTRQGSTLKHITPTQKMDDLIEELEMWAKHDPIDTSVPFGKLFKRAADELKFLDRMQVRVGALLHQVDAGTLSALRAIDKISTEVWYGRYQCSITPDDSDQESP